MTRNVPEHGFVEALRSRLAWIPAAERELSQDVSRRLLIAGLTLVAVSAAAFFLAPPYRSVAIVAVVLVAAIFSVAQQMPGAGAFALALVLALSEYQPNSVAQMLSRYQLGSIWAAQLTSRFVAADLALAVALGLTMWIAFRARARLGIAKLDRLMIGLALIILCAAIIGLVSRDGAEDLRFWLFDVRAFVYLFGGYFIARTLVLSSTTHQAAQLAILLLGMTFVAAAAYNTLFPTGFYTVSATNVILISELALLVTTFLLLGGVYAGRAPRPGLLLWAGISAVMFFVDYISGRRLVLLFVSLALIGIAFVAGRARWRVLVSLAGAVVGVFVVFRVVSPTGFDLALSSYVRTVQVATEIATGEGRASSSPAPSVRSSEPSDPVATASPTVPSENKDLAEVQVEMGMDTRIGEIHNVLGSLQARDALVQGLGLGKLWTITFPQPDDFFAVGPDLYGTGRRFATHVPGLDYLLRFGVVGSALWIVWGGLLVRFALAQRGASVGVCLAAVLSGFLLLQTLWGNPRDFFLVGLLLGLVWCVAQESKEVAQRDTATSR